MITPDTRLNVRLRIRPEVVKLAQEIFGENLSPAFEGLVMRQAMAMGRGAPNRDLAELITERDRLAQLISIKTNPASVDQTKVLVQTVTAIFKTVALMARPLKIPKPREILKEAGAWGIADPDNAKRSRTLSKIWAKYGLTQPVLVDLAKIALSTWEAQPFTTPEKGQELASAHLRDELGVSV